MASALLQCVGFFLMPFFIQTINILFDLLSVVLLLRVVFSWLVPQGGPLVAFLHQCTEPLLTPIRRLLPRTGMIDFSPMVALFLLHLIQTFLNSAFYSF